MGLSALVFLILFGYAIVRPATESLFVEAHSAEALPKAWLLVALSSVIIVSAYSHWAARIDLVAGFGLSLPAHFWRACINAFELPLDA